MPLSVGLAGAHTAAGDGVAWLQSTPPIASSPSALLSPLPALRSLQTSPGGGRPPACPPGSWHTSSHPCSRPPQGRDCLTSGEPRRGRLAVTKGFLLAHLNPSPASAAGGGGGSWASSGPPFPPLRGDVMMPTSQHCSEDLLCTQSLAQRQQPALRSPMSSASRPRRWGERWGERLALGSARRALATANLSQTCWGSSAQRRGHSCQVQAGGEQGGHPQHPLLLHRCRQCGGLLLPVHVLQRHQRLGLLVSLPLLPGERAGQSRAGAGGQSCPPGQAGRSGSGFCHHRRWSGPYCSCSQSLGPTVESGGPQTTLVGL